MNHTGNQPPKTALYQKLTGYETIHLFSETSQHVGIIQTPKKYNSKATQFKQFQSKPKGTIAQNMHRTKPEEDCLIDHYCLPLTIPSIS